MSLSLRETGAALNPYESLNHDLIGHTATKTSLTHKAIVSVVVPIVVSLLAYSLFRLVASRLNVATWHSNDNFYYSIATATWPIYAFFVAGCVAFVSKRKSIPWYLTILMFALGLITMLFVGETDHICGYRDSGRNGLFEYSSNVDSWSTPKLSASLILPVYFVTFVCVRFLPTRKKRDNNDMHTKDSVHRSNLR